MPKYTRRKDGLLQVKKSIKGRKTPLYFYAKTEREMDNILFNFKEAQEKGRMFSAVADEWKEKHFITLENGTKMCYSPALRRSKEEFEKKYIKDVNSNDINRLITQLKNKKYSAKTIKTQKTVLNMIFNYAIIQRDIELNPVTAITIPKNLPKKRRDIPTNEQLDIVKNSVDKHFGLFAYFLLYTGCRRGEALALKWQDINMDANAITINKSVYFENNKPKIKNPKTEAGTREIILLDTLKKALPNINMEDFNKYIFGGQDTPMTETALQWHWEIYCKESGLVKETNKDGKIIMVHSITAHQLRHAYATVLFEAGIDEFTAKELLGHSDIKLTHDIYTHLRSKQKGLAANKLNQYINTNGV